MNMNRPTQAWSEADDALLRELHAKGLSAREIAAKLSGTRSRNAVIGRIHRKLHGLRDTRKRPNRKVAPRKRKPSPPKLLKGKRTFFRPMKVAPSKPHRPGKPVDFLSLKDNLCKFAVSGLGGHKDPFMFCGGPVREGASYCEYHCGVAYNGFQNIKPKTLLRFSGGR